MESEFDSFFSNMVNNYSGQAFLKKLLAVIFSRIKSCYEDPFNVQEISNCLGLSERTFYRRINECGMSYFNIKEDIRKNYCLYLMSLNKYNVNEISNFLFFKSPSYFVYTFKKWHGCTPRKYSFYS